MVSAQCHPEFGKGLEMMVRGPKNKALLWSLAAGPWRGRSLAMGLTPQVSWSLDGERRGRSSKGVAEAGVSWSRGREAAVIVLGLQS